MHMQSCFFALEASCQSGYPETIMLLQAELDQFPPEVPTYLTAAIGPSKTASARKWCSVCGNLSP